MQLLKRHPLRTEAKGCSAHIPLPNISGLCSAVRFMRWTHNTWTGTPYVAPALVPVTVLRPNSVSTPSVVDCVARRLRPPSTRPRISPLPSPCTYTTCCWPTPDVYIPTWKTSLYSHGMILIHYLARGVFILRYRRPHPLGLASLFHPTRPTCR